VRTFAEQVKHLAAANYQLGSKALGVQPPAGTKNESAPESVKTKAEIMQYLRGSFSCLHRAAAMLDEKSRHLADDGELVFNLNFLTGGLPQRPQVSVHGARVTEEKARQEAEYRVGNLAIFRDPDYSGPAIGLKRERP
jgi:hypothetical protein